MFLTHSEREVLHMIRSHLEDYTKYPIYLDELVDQYKLKLTKLTWGFRMLFNESIHKYYNRHAMVHARSLLEGGAQVKEAAIALGYSRQGSFSRAFKAYYGFNPGEVRPQ